MRGETLFAGMSYHDNMFIFKGDERQKVVMR